MHDHFHAQAQLAIFAIMKIAFLLVLATTIIVTVLRLVGLGFAAVGSKWLGQKT